MKRAFVWAMPLFAVVAVAGCGHKPPVTEGELKAGGSTFVTPLMNKWIEEYGKGHATKITYSAIGSGAGVFQMIDQTLDFSCTDAPMDHQELLNAKSVGGEVVHIPIALGAVVPGYNLADIDPPVNFTGPLLADIFLGKIKKWNDPKLQAVQEASVKLPDLDITVVHRSDGSGTTYVFADFLSRTSPEWRNGMGTATAFKWPVGSGQNGNKWVAAHCKRTPGALGYMELEYAVENDLRWGAVKNKAGKFVQGMPSAIRKTAEVAAKDIPDDLIFSLADAPGEESYPICSATWALVYANPPRNAKEIVDFLRWALGDGQKYASKVHFMPLPPNLAERANKRLDVIQVK